MKLTNKQKRHLRALAHKLKPVVTVGNAGLSDSVLREIDLTLEHHELIKVRINCGDRDEHKKLIEDLCDKSNANLVQSIGFIAAIYRPADKPIIKLPG